MRKFKKFAAMASAVVLAACAVAPLAMNSFAVDGENTGTETGGEAASPVDGKTKFNLASPELPTGASVDTIKAIQIFTGSVDANGDFSVSGWGANVTDGAKAALATAAGAQGETDAGKVAVALSKLTTDAEKAAFAEVAVAQLGSVAGIGASEYANGIVTFESELGTGYYLVICEAKGATGDAWTAKSLGMLTATGKTTDTTIGTGTAKVGLPEVQKKVQENDAANCTTLDAAPYETDKTYNDVADYNIGDAVPFKLYGTLPDDYDKYEKYFYQFNDSLDTQFNAPASVKVNINGNDYTFTKGDTGYTTTAVGATGVTVTWSTTDGNKLTVAIADLKAHIANKAAVTSTTTAPVTVSYSAVLNDTAKVGTEGQENKVTLTYSNNPNQSGDGEYDNDNNKGETPEDEVIVHTYDMQFEKTFWNGQSNLTQEEITSRIYENLAFNLVGPDGKNVKVKKLTGDANYDYIVADETNTSDNTIIEDMSLTVIGNEGSQKLVIRIKGLDDGGYTFKEKVATDAKDKTVGGYTTDKKIGATLTVDTNNTQNGYDNTTSSENNSITGNIVKTYDDGDTEAEKDEYGDLENTKGINLPSTGGIGTTMFYIGGGAMVAVAGVFLITKKRMSKKEN